MKKILCVFLILCMNLCILSGCNKSILRQNTDETSGQNVIQTNKAEKAQDNIALQKDELDCKGLIIGEWIVNQIVNDNALNGYHYLINVKSVDISTGNETTISSFEFDKTSSLPENRSGYAQNFGMILFGQLPKDMFSNNYDRVIMEWRDSNGKTSAGWMDTNGKFTNVTEILQMSPEKGIGFSPIGFIDDYFVFGEWKNDNYNDLISKKYYVPYNDLKRQNVKEGEPYQIFRTNTMSYDMSCYGKTKSVYTISQNLSETIFVHDRQKGMDGIVFPQDQLQSLVSGVLNSSEDKMIFLGSDSQSEKNSIYLADMSSLSNFTKLDILSHQKYNFGIMRGGISNYWHEGKPQHYLLEYRD